MIRRNVHLSGRLVRTILSVRDSQNNHFWLTPISPVSPYVGPKVADCTAIAGWIDLSWSELLQQMSLEPAQFAGPLQSLEAHAALSATVRCYWHRHSPMPTALGSSEVWRLYHAEQLENVTTNFFKKLYNWQIIIPNYIVRHETGWDNIALAVFRKNNSMVEQRIGNGKK